MSETPRYILCPYCGHPQPLGDQCNACGGLFEPLSRKATQISMGPWYIRDRNSPFRPGCSFQVLKKQIDAGRVKPNTVLRGPTTHQFWSVARNTPGVSHLLGYCHECNASVKPTDTACPKCSVDFTLPDKRNELGLLYPNTASAANAQKSLDREINKIFGPGQSARSASKTDAAITLSEEDQTRAPVQGGIDLLDQVLNAGSGKSARSSHTSAATSTKQKHASTSHPKPTSLDFTPTLETEDQSASSRKTAASGAARKDGAASQHDSQGSLDQANPTAPVPAAGGSTHWLIWILVASNLIVVGLLAAAVWLLKQPQG